MTRRGFLKSVSAAALIAASPIGMTNPASAVASGTIFGAIRWDAWYGANGTTGNVEKFVEGSLSRNDWHSRAPWFSTVNGPNSITINGNAQANMDLELQAANAAGIQYWAYDIYPTASGVLDNTSGMNNAWLLHQSSTYKNLVKWAILLQTPASVSAMEAMNAQFIAYMQQSNYLTVLGGRPVFFWLTSANLTSAWAAAVTDLRTKATAAGLGNPFIVMMVTQDPTNSATMASLVGADAISSYAFFSYGTAASYISQLESFWTTSLGIANANSLQYVPTVQTGDDTRPRIEVPTIGSTGIPWARHSYYAQTPTNVQVVGEITDAINFVKANPTACASTLILGYSWDECDEGGNVLMPTIGDPPSVNYPYKNGIETSLSAILP